MKTLSRTIKAWRGKTPAREAAAILGVPRRTLEGIEHGRPFRYERLLRHALKTMPAPDTIDWSDEDHAEMAAWMRQEGILK